MLLSYSFSNFKSFEKLTTLELAATSDKTHSNHVSNIFSDSKRKESVLRVGAIYGGNASGKSNVVESISFSRKLLLRGTAPHTNISIDQFRLAEAGSSEFQYIFMINNKVFTYSFIINRERVLSESFLSRTSSSRNITIFDRSENLSETKFNKSFFNSKSQEDVQFLEFIARGTRANQLLLTELFSKDIPQLKDVYRWFNECLVIIAAESRYGGLEPITKHDEGFASFVSKFLSSIDSNNSGVRAEDHAIDLNAIGVPSDAINEINQQLGPDEVASFRIGNKRYHVSKGKNGELSSTKMIIEKLNKRGEKIDFELTDESEGTQRLINLLPAIYSSMKNPRTFIIDEIDRRLHPNMTAEIISSFIANSESTNGQLIFTTHDSNLLDLDMLRRDEIWFVDKDKFGSSSLYPLSDFKVRKDLDIEKGYLLGRFGGVPRIKNFHLIKASSAKTFENK